MPGATVRKITAPQLAPATAKECLGRSDRIAWTQIIAGFVFGVPLLFLGPMFVALLLWLRHGPKGSYWAWVFDCAPLVIPALLLLEIASSGKYLEDLAGRLDDSPFVRRRSGGVIIFFFFSLLGPGIVMAAFRRWQRLKKHVGASRDRAAQTLSDLYKADGGVDIFTLLRPQEDLGELMPVLEYLVDYDWIGASKMGDRIWLLSEGRKR